MTEASIIILSFIFDGIMGIILVLLSLNLKGSKDWKDSMNKSLTSTRETVLTHDVNCTDYSRRLTSLENTVKNTVPRPEMEGSLKSIRLEAKEMITRIERDVSNMQEDVRQLRNTYQDAYKGLEHHFKMVESSLQSFAEILRRQGLQE